MSGSRAGGHSPLPRARAWKPRGGSAGPVRVPLDVLERFMADVFTGLGVPRADAGVCAGVLAAADERGIDSHGIARMKAFYYDRLKAGLLAPVARPRLVREGPTTAVIDGGNGLGHVIGKRAMELCIRKAGARGLGMAAVRNSSHYGIAGYYAMLAARAGMIGVTGTNARPAVAPTFGVENMLGTNPLTIAAPTDEPFPFVIDCATSLTQRGKIEVAARLGKPVPEGWVIGRDGRPKTGAKAILADLLAGAAALAPLGGIGEDGGGHKGYGYATAVEILCSALQGGPFLKALSGFEGGRKVPCRIGHFFLAADIRAFCPLARFKRTAGGILRALRASRKAPGHARIYTAGEKEHLRGLERRRLGVPLTAETRREVIAMRDELGLAARYPFNF